MGPIGHHIVISFMESIPFFRPSVDERDLNYIKEALFSDNLQGDGPWTRKAEQYLTKNFNTDTLLTHSCSGALELCALLLNIMPGDEVIVPSYTFTSTISTFAMRGAVPVFIDSRADCINIDETKIEAAITPKTKAIVVMHYAGVSCEMDTILDIAKRHNLAVVEDAAQGMDATYKGRPLGTMGNLGTISFHGTKNIVSGEGGALILNDLALSDRARILREKGSNRSLFLRGQVDKYTWVDASSSFLASEITAAFLCSQLEKMKGITTSRLQRWNQYHTSLELLEKAGKLTRPFIPKHCMHNAHIYYIFLENREHCDGMREYLAAQNIKAVSHYMPLHDSPAGQKYGYTPMPITVANSINDRLLRLPLWAEMTQDQTCRVIDAVQTYFK